MGKWRVSRRGGAARSRARGRALARGRTSTSRAGRSYRYRGRSSRRTTARSARRGRIAPRREVTRLRGRITSLGSRLPHHTTSFSGCEGEVLGRGRRAFSCTGTTLLKSLLRDLSGFSEAVSTTGSTASPGSVTSKVGVVGADLMGVLRSGCKLMNCNIRKRRFGPSRRRTVNHYRSRGTGARALGRICLEKCGLGRGMVHRTGMVIGIPGRWGNFWFGKGVYWGTGENVGCKGGC